MNKFNCILFDLDGTLIDTTPLIMESFRHTFMHHFNRQVQDEELLSFLGIPLIKPFMDLYPDKAEDLVVTYKKFNERNHDFYTGVFIGIPHVLGTLKEKGILLGVVTSKRRDLAMRGMKLFDLDKYMDVFVGLEDTTIHKPKPEPILKALELAGLTDRDKVLYVGDSPYDILSARNAGVKSAAVMGWSYLPEGDLLEVEPDICLKSPKDLLLHI